MEGLIVLRNGSLTLPKEFLEALGLKGNEILVVKVIDGQIVLQPLYQVSTERRQKLIEQLNLPVGSLAHQVPQPENSITIEEELGGEIYGDID
ncbi:MAG: AbrB/MazE/SpoVT family DNA-binding domain-containing protein [Armatimonadetes bacterium]|nr:AbrB/MazE/SpoVT family DNA-binding domain-containing protein [Armatimonadota bacterium]MDW8027675.1 AbrB/MazE/SpoVT family DNA-binding domain-containing protein [Armatimonadota bacterium]